MKVLAVILLSLCAARAAAPISAEFGGTGRAALASGKIMVDSSLRVVGYRTPAQLWLITTTTISDSLTSRLFHLKRDTNTWTGVQTFTQTIAAMAANFAGRVNTTVTDVSEIDQAHGFRVTNAAGKLATMEVTTAAANWQSWGVPMYLNPLGNNIHTNRDGGNFNVGTASDLGFKLGVSGNIGSTALSAGGPLCAVAGTGEIKIWSSYPITGSCP